MASIDELWRRLGRARADEAEDLAAGFVDTLDGVLEPAGAIPTDRGLAASMEAHVAANLDDLDLDVDALRATFHCSRSAVYRLFEPHGGVAAYIRELRLLRCFEELSRPAKLPRRVSEVATRWGFDNPSHFHRLFTAKFGLPPSGLRGSVEPGWEVRVPPAAAGMVHRFHSWTTAI